MTVHKMVVAKGMNARPDPALIGARRYRLAAQIVEIARMRGLLVGAHLATTPLAEALGVSRSPVLRAFELLEAVGVICRQENRGYFVVDLDAYAAQAVQSDEERVYWRLVNDRIDGQLPDDIDEASLMRRYDAPRRLVSRLMGRLAEEEIVTRRAGLGWSFHPPLDAEQAAASVRYRLLLEPAALMEPSYRAPRAELAAIIDEQRRLFDDADTPGQSIVNFDRNAAFHEAVAGWSGNAFLLDGVRRHNCRRRLTQYRHFVRPGRIRQSATEHLDVLNSIAAGDLRTARDHLIAHIRNAPISAQALREVGT
ncbi:MAG: GntR family transcriptional regulator [Jannaschia sp.]